MCATGHARTRNGRLPRSSTSSSLTSSGRRDQLAALRQVAEVALQGLLIELAARSQRSRQLRMADELRLIRHERSGAQHVVGVHVREDHVAHGSLRDAPDRRTQRCTHRQRAARVDHCDTAVADDEADIGLVAEIAG